MNRHGQLPLRLAESQVASQTLNLPDMQSIDSIVSSPSDPWAQHRPGMTNFTHLLRIFIQ